MVMVGMLIVTLPTAEDLATRVNRVCSSATVYTEVAEHDALFEFFILSLNVKRQTSLNLSLTKCLAEGAIFTTRQQSEWGGEFGCQSTTGTPGAVSLDNVFSLVHRELPQ